MNRPTQSLARPLFALMLVFTLAGGIAEAQTKVNPGFNLFSAQQDVEIGQQSAAEAEQQLPVMNDAQINAYVNDIGQKLAKNAGGPNFPYRFRVVNASDINAFALPGGYIYLNRGIIDNADNEGEVAGVLAHEIAHVALRHGTHQASKAYAAQAGLSILGGLLGGKVGGNTAQILNAVGGLGLNALFLKFSRELETQADVRGAQILAASGYSPADMVGFFHELEKVDKSKKTTWLSHHPAPPDRIKRIEQEARLLRVNDNPTTNTAQLAEVKSQMRRYGNAPTMADISRGVTSGGNTQQQPTMTSSSTAGRVEAPSRTWTTHTDNSGVYKISYPSNWRVYDTSGFNLTVAPEGGVGTVGGRTEIVYGAMISHYDPASSRVRSSFREGTTGQVTLSSATSDLIAQIQNTSPHLRVIRGSEQRLTVDGQAALAASMRGTNPQTRIDERVTVVTRPLADGHMMYMLFVTPERDAASYQTVLNTMIKSVNVDDARRH